jgi:hypothetical protein
MLAKIKASKIAVIQTAIRDNLRSFDALRELIEALEAERKDVESQGEKAERQRSIALSDPRVENAYRRAMGLEAADVSGEPRRRRRDAGRRNAG